jgi:hypothetical protein
MSVKHLLPEATNLGTTTAPNPVYHHQLAVQESLAAPPNAPKTAIQPNAKIAHRGNTETPMLNNAIFAHLGFTKTKPRNNNASHVHQHCVKC